MCYNKRSSFYIMNATRALHNKNKVSIKDIVKEASIEIGFTILVCKRQTNRWDEPDVPLFVTSYSTGYDKLGPTTYTQDTGLGYKLQNHELVVENIITYHKGESKPRALNTIGLDSKLPHWVCK